MFLRLLTLLWTLSPFKVTFYVFIHTHTGHNIGVKQRSVGSSWVLIPLSRKRRCGRSNSQCFTCQTMRCTSGATEQTLNFYLVRHCLKFSAFPSYLIMLETYLCRETANAYCEIFLISPTYKCHRILSSVCIPRHYFLCIGLLSDCMAPVGLRNVNHGVCRLWLLIGYEFQFFTY